MSTLTTTASLEETSAGGPAPADCLAPSTFVDSDAPVVVAYAERLAGGATDPLEKARRTLERRYGFCITKAALLAAVARAQGIPARLGFADVRNHLTSPRLREHMGTDVFVFHGYTELHLGDRWVKATPAFNFSLCERARILPLEFNGVDDSIYHPFDADGRRHMEYLRYRGEYLDIPVEELLAAVVSTYGEKGRQWLGNSVAEDVRFEDEVG